MRKMMLVFAALMAAFTLAPAAAQQRFALVIGNAAYRNLPTLPNTVNDAEDIAAALSKLGYQVDLRRNLDMNSFDEAVSAYIRKLEQNSGNEGFFWYAGHGIQLSNDGNYLLPVDFPKIEDRPDTRIRIARNSYALRDLLSELDRTRNRANVVVLDACRDNPLPSTIRSAASSRGLALLSSTPPDLIIMYSTAAGAVAVDGMPGKRNSPFAEAFLKHIAKPDPISLVMADITNETYTLTRNVQRPYLAGTIMNRNYSLNPSATVAAAPAPGAPAVSAPAVSAPNQKPALDSDAMRDSFNGDWVSSDTRLEINGNRIIQYFKNPDGSWDPTIPDKQIFLRDRNNLVYIWLNKGGVWTETQVFSLSNKNSNALDFLWARHVNNIMDSANNEAWRVNDVQTLFRADSSRTLATDPIRQSNSQTIPDQFIGNWIGSIAYDEGNRQMTVRIVVTKNSVTQYFQDGDDSWYAADPDNSCFEFDRNNLVFAWLNKGGIWTETQVYSLSILNNRTANVVWIRHVNNYYRDEPVNDTWYLSGEGQLTK